MSRPTLTIVVPIHNESSRLPRLFDSLEAQGPRLSTTQVVYVDSASEDDSSDVVRRQGLRGSDELICLESNHGPGAARNAGLERAVGEWIMFIDADDALAPGALETIYESMQRTSEDELDLIAFNWRYSDADPSTVLKRRDHRYLGDPCAWLRRFSQHQVDGSVIFWAFRRSLIEGEKLRFDDGLHEDVYFLFRSYFAARSVAYIDQPLYVKYPHRGSVTSTTSSLHLAGFIAAYTKIMDWWAENSCPACGESHATEARRGLAAAFASRSREVVRRIDSDQNRLELLSELRRTFGELQASGTTSIAELPSGGRYRAVLTALLEASDVVDTQTIKAIEKIDSESVSCEDLHHSVFLAPGEIRTCCKRFFVDGEMRGDAVLDIELSDSQRSLDPATLWTAKRDLWLDINSGEITQCSGCPYLVEDQWPPVDRPLDLHLVSLEHHSVCNLRCTYCDETYFGGARPNYNVSETLEGFASAGTLEQCRLFVWGGGEPTLDPKFEQLVDTAAEAAPTAKHRILSNSVRYSVPVEKALKSGQAQLVTSIDAGNPATFKLVRGRKGFDSAFENLEQYVGVAPHKVTVKYIVTSDNTSAADVYGFIEEVGSRNLQQAYFQVSGDFKVESLTNEMLLAAIRLFAGLSELQVYHVYMDEHIWYRWIASAADGLDADLMAQLTPAERSWIAEPGGGEIALWGAGQLSHLLLARPGFVQRWRISDVVDSFQERVGKDFAGLTIQPTSSLQKSDSHVFLSGIQGMVAMREEFAALNLQETRLYRQLLW